jgi:hypothetical protein
MVVVVMGNEIPDGKQKQYMQKLFVFTMMEASVTHEEGQNG